MLDINLHVKLQVIDFELTPENTLNLIHHNHFFYLIQYSHHVVTLRENLYLDPFVCLLSQCFIKNNIPFLGSHDIIMANIIDSPNKNESLRQAKHACLEFGFSPGTRNFFEFLESLLPDLLENDVFNTTLFLPQILNISDL